MAADNVRYFHGQPDDDEDIILDPWSEPIPLDDDTRKAFPIDVLAPFGSMAAFVTSLAEFTQTPVDLPAVTALGTLSAAAGGKFEVEVEPGYVEPANLFLLNLLPSGLRKSAVFRSCTAPILAWERERNDRETKDLAVWQSRRRVNEAKLKAMETALVSANKKASSVVFPDDIQRMELETEALVRELAADKPPRVTQIIADDITAEKLAGLLADQEGSLAVMSPEGGFFGNIGGRYSDLPALETMLKGHAADGIRVNRQGRSGEIVPRPCLTVCISAQPDVAAELGKIPGFRGKGGAARFLVSMPKSNLGQRKPSGIPIPVQVERDWATCITRILDMNAASRDDHDGYPIPHRLRLTDGARLQHVQFRQEAEPELGELGFLADLADWASKLSGAVARIAGLLHVAIHPDPHMHRISEATMDAAINIAEYFIDHAFLFFDAMANDDGSTLSVARIVFNELCEMADYAKTDNVSRRDLNRKLRKRSRFKESSSLDIPLARLEENGFIQIVNASTGGRPSKQIYINPLARKY